MSFFFELLKTSVFQNEITEENKNLFVQSVNGLIIKSVGVGESLSHVCYVLYDLVVIMQLRIQDKKQLVVSFFVLMDLIGQSNQFQQGIQNFRFLLLNFRHVIDIRLSLADNSIELPNNWFVAVLKAIVIQSNTLSNNLDNFRALLLNLKYILELEDRFITKEKKIELCDSVDNVLQAIAIQSNHYTLLDNLCFFNEIVYYTYKISDKEKFIETLLKNINNICNKNIEDFRDALQKSFLAVKFFFDYNNFIFIDKDNLSQDKFYKFFESQHKPDIEQSSELAIFYEVINIFQKDKEQKFGYKLAIVLNSFFECLEDTELNNFDQKDSFILSINQLMKKINDSDNFFDDLGNLDNLLSKFKQILTSDLTNKGKFIEAFLVNINNIYFTFALKKSFDELTFFYTCITYLNTLSQDKFYKFFELQYKPDIGQESELAIFYEVINICHKDKEQKFGYKLAIVLNSFFECVEKITISDQKESFSTSINLLIIDIDDLKLIQDFLSNFHLIFDIDKLNEKFIPVINKLIQKISSPMVVYHQKGSDMLNCIKILKFLKEIYFNVDPDVNLPENEEKMNLIETSLKLIDLICKKEQAENFSQQLDDVKKILVPVDSSLDPMVSPSNVEDKESLEPESLSHVDVEGSLQPEFLLNQETFLNVDIQILNIKLITRLIYTHKLQKLEIFFTVFDYYLNLKEKIENLEKVYKEFISALLDENEIYDNICMKKYTLIEDLVKIIYKQITDKKDEIKFQEKIDLELIERNLEQIQTNKFFLIREISLSVLKICNKEEDMGKNLVESSIILISSEQFNKDLIENLLNLKGIFNVFVDLNQNTNYVFSIEQLIKLVNIINLNSSDDIGYSMDISYAILNSFSKIAKIGHEEIDKDKTLVLFVNLIERILKSEDNNNKTVTTEKVEYIFERLSESPDLLQVRIDLMTELMAEQKIENLDSLLNILTVDSNFFTLENFKAIDLKAIKEKIPDFLIKQYNFINPVSELIKEKIQIQSKESYELILDISLSELYLFSHYCQYKHDILKDNPTVNLINNANFNEDLMVNLKELKVLSLNYAKRKNDEFIEQFFHLIQQISTIDNSEYLSYSLNFSSKVLDEDEHINEESKKNEIDKLIDDIKKKDFEFIEDYKKKLRDSTYPLSPYMDGDEDYPPLPYSYNNDMEDHNYYPNVDHISDTHHQSEDDKREYFEHQSFKHQPYDNDQQKDFKVEIEENELDHNSNKSLSEQNEEEQRAREEAEQKRLRDASAAEKQRKREEEDAEAQRFKEQQEAAKRVREEAEQKAKQDKKLQKEADAIDKTDKSKENDSSHGDIPPSNQKAPSEEDKDSSHGKIPPFNQEAPLDPNLINDPELQLPDLKRKESIDPIDPKLDPISDSKEEESLTLAANESNFSTSQVVVVGSTVLTTVGVIVYKRSSRVEKAINRGLIKFIKSPVGKKIMDMLPANITKPILKTISNSPEIPRGSNIKFQQPTMAKLNQLQKIPKSRQLPNNYPPKNAPKKKTQAMGYSSRINSPLAIN